MYDNVMKRVTTETIGRLRRLLAWREWHLEERRPPAAQASLQAAIPLTGKSGGYPPR